MLIVDAQIHLWNAGNPTNPNQRQGLAYLNDARGRESLQRFAREVMPAFAAASGLTPLPRPTSGG